MALATWVYICYQCTVSHIVIYRCPKSFSVLAMLKRHVDHVHENIRPHRCDVCGKGFFEAADLRSHKLVVHENIKEWHCDQCPKSFGYKRELIKHVGHIHSEHKVF